MTDPPNYDDLPLAGVEFAPGDIILLHTGFAAWYADRSSDEKFALPQQLKTPGIDHSEEVARYLWDAHVSAVASETFAVEVWSPDFSAEAAPFGFLHHILIGQFGLALGSCGGSRNWPTTAPRTACMRSFW